jgi:sugar/nucleoside kinase (ribokinase family)
MFDIITIGGAARDIFFEIKKIKPVKTTGKFSEEYLKVPYGEKMISDATYYDYGGGAVNSAVAISRLGLKSAVLCNIGKEGSGDLIVKYLECEKVSTSFVRRDPTLHTGLSILIVGRDGEHTGFLERGASDNLLVERWRPLKKTRWFYVGSLTGKSAYLLPELFNFAEREGIKIAFNPGSQQLSGGYLELEDYIKRSDIFLLNLEEATNLIYSKTRKKPKNEINLLNEIEKMGAGVSVVTEDGEGCHAVSNGKKYHQRAFSTKVVDTTGAGDSFGATLTFGVMKGFDIGYSLKIAAINAASVVAEMGANKGLMTYNKIRNSKWL